MPVSFSPNFFDRTIKNCIEDWLSQNDNKSVEVYVGLTIVANGDKI